MENDAASTTDHLPDRYLSKSAVATFLAVSTRTVDRLDSDQSPGRTFPVARRITGKKRWLLSAVAAWAAAQD